ncbi:MAG: twin-arginine translocase TatA/TatE family subunit [Nitrospirae bacterium]|nr:twin-arginine translocase TatA/TatE family subunit [Nitrospirota bacterium]
MFNFSLPELFVIFAVALIVLGPEKLPEIGRALGKGIAQLQRSLQGVREQMNDVVNEADREGNAGPKAENNHAEAGTEKSHTFGGSETLHAHDSTGKDQTDASSKEHS